MFRWFAIWFLVAGLAVTGYDAFLQETREDATTQQESDLEPTGEGTDGLPPN